MLKVSAAGEHSPGVFPAGSGKTTGLTRNTAPRQAIDREKETISTTP
jgi:hypothetical protein